VLFAVKTRHDCVPAVGRLGEIEGSGNMGRIFSCLKTWRVTLGNIAEGGGIYDESTVSGGKELVPKDLGNLNPKELGQRNPFGNREVSS
jgi:hypothetical protein